MGSFTAYMIEASLLLSLMFVAYKLSLGRLKCLSLMRATLLLIYPLCLILPAIIRLPLLATDRPNAPTLSGFTTLTHIEPSPSVETITSSEIIVIIAIGGMAITALLTVTGLLRLLCLSRKAQKRVIDGVSVYVLPDKQISPFSFFTRIYFNRQDAEERNRMLLTHEMAHIRLMHWVDLVLARTMCIMQWWNPFAWVMDKELHAIHEFQADQAVMNEGLDMKEYQYYLIRKAVGTRLQTLADSLNHSKLKTRLTMMKKENSNVKSRLAGMIMIPAAAIGMAFLSMPAVARLTAEIRDVAFTLPQRSESGDKVSEKIPNGIIENVLPSKHGNISSPSFSAEESAPSAEAKEVDSQLSGSENPRTEAGKEASSGTENGEKAGKAAPRYEIDGVLVDENYDLNSLNPSEIKSMEVVKNNPDFPNGLIKIKLLKGEEKQKPEGKRKDDDDLLISVKSIDNENGTHLVFQFLTDEEVHLKDVVWTIDGKDYKPESVSSSFSKSGNNGYQSVKIDLPATLKKFKYGKDKISFTRDNGARESFTIPLDLLAPAI